MGTLGCINDMLQRDKENRALRKLSRGRMREHYKYLVERKGPERADVTIEKIEEIRRNTTEKELSDKVLSGEGIGSGSFSREELLGLLS